MENVIIIAIVSAIVFLAAYYVYRSKKKGQKCIGCPYSGTCASENHCSCGSFSQKEE